MTDIETPASSVPGPRQSSPDRRRRKGPIATAVALVIATGLVLWYVWQNNDQAPLSSPATRSPASPTVGVDTTESARTAADFEVIYKDLDATRARAFAEYKPELLAEVYGPDCSASCGVEQSRTTIQEMAAAGARFSQDQAQLLGVELVGQFDGVILEGAPRRMVTIRVTDEHPPFHVIRRDGTQGPPHPGWEPTSRALDLYFSPTKGHWLINNRLVEGPVADLPTLSPGALD
jgi:hypothetical protein